MVGVAGPAARDRRAASRYLASSRPVGQAAKPTARGGALLLGGDAARSEPVVLRLSVGATARRSRRLGRGGAVPSTGLAIAAVGGHARIAVCGPRQPDAHASGRRRVGIAGKNLGSLGL